MLQIPNLMPSDRRRLNRVWAFAQNNEGPADHSKVQIAEGKARAKIYCIYITPYNRLLWWQVTNKDDRYGIFGRMKGRL